MIRQITKYYKSAKMRLKNRKDYLVHTASSVLTCQEVTASYSLFV